MSLSQTFPPQAFPRAIPRALPDLAFGGDSLARRTRVARPARIAAAESADTAVHPGAIFLGLLGYGVFLSASWLGWGFGETALLIAVISVLGAMYFGLMVWIGMRAEASRETGPRRDFLAFVTGRVETLTGRIKGSEVLVQIALLPALLGLLMSWFALVWLMIR
jgi:hypothetical protein